MAHVHLWLTRVPSLGSIFLIVLLLVTPTYHTVLTQKVSLWFLGRIALFTTPTFFSGEAVEDLPGVSTAMIHLQTFVFRCGLGLMCATGIIVLGGAFISRNGPTLPRALVATMLALLLVNAALGFLRGQIYHQEIRTSARSFLIETKQGSALNSARQAAQGTLRFLPSR